MITVKRVSIIFVTKIDKLFSVKRASIHRPRDRMKDKPHPHLFIYIKRVSRASDVQISRKIFFLSL